MTNKPESAAVEAVAWIDMAKLSGHGMVYATPFKCSDRQSPLYPQSALDALRGEVERSRRSNELYSFAMNTAGIDELKRRADAAERRVAQLEIVLEQAMEHPDFLPPGLLESIESALTKESP